MLKSVELIFFSIFFVFSFIKVFVSTFVDTDNLTYIYYLILSFFLSNYYLRNSRESISWLFLALVLSIVWLSLIGLLGSNSEFYGFGKLQALVISAFSIPIAVYMYKRNLLAPAVRITTLFLVVVAGLFSNLVTYDENDPAYVLNNAYLHGSFISGFMVLLSILIRLSSVWPIALIGCLMVFGGRGPSLCLAAVLTVLGAMYLLKLISRRKLSMRLVSFTLLSVPLVGFIVIYLMPTIFDRMIARWHAFLSTTGGGESAQRRIEHLRASIDAFSNNPLMGIGMGDYGRFLNGYPSDSHPHNFILEVLAENGLVGGLPFLFCIGLLFAKSVANKTWPLILYVILCLLISYSYSTANELYFALTLAIVAMGGNRMKNEDIRNYGKSSV